MNGDDLIIDVNAAPHTPGTACDVTPVGFCKTHQRYVKCGMFSTLTYTEWDALCSALERAMTEVHRSWDISSYEHAVMSDDLLDLHGLLMARPTV